MIRVHQLLVKGLLMGIVAVGPAILSGCSESVPEGPAKTDTVEKQKAEDGMRKFMEQKAKGGGAPKK